MRWNDYFRLGINQLMRRKVVTALCAIGIAIGSASIIVALAFGESVTHYSEQSMGYYLKTDEINVYPQSDAGFGGPGGTASSVETAGAATNAISDQQIKLIRTFPHVKAAAIQESFGYMSFTVDDTKLGSFDLSVTDLDQLTAFGSQFQQGGPSDSDNSIVISYGAMADIADMNAKPRPGQNAQDYYENVRRQIIFYPLYKKQITLHISFPFSQGERTVDLPVRVSGVLKKPDGMPDDRVRNQKEAYISPALGKKIKEALTSAGITGFQSQNLQMKVKVDSTANVEQTEKLIQKLKLRTMSNLYQMERMNNEFVVLRLVFGGAGLFILFVASISIVVAMTMSTYQRRRQIGIMKVLGSNLRQIRNMFIVESALLGLIGGLLGIMLSYWVIWGINIVVNSFSNQNPGSDPEFLFISSWILPVGLFFALLTGVLSGIYPAVKASRTDALTAIKRE